MIAIMHAGRVTVLSGFLPIWAITAVGWAAGRFDVLGAQAQHVLGRFAFAFAMPALLFLTLSRARVSDLAGPGVAVFAASLLIVFALGLVLGRWVFRRRQADRAIGAMAGAYVNSANLGIPVAVHVLNDASFFIAAALFQTLFITPLILVLIDLDVRRGARDRWGRILQLPVRNPIIAASAAGVTVAALGWRLPAGVTAPVQMLGGAAVPAALFALGMSLNAPATRPDAAGRTERRVLVAVKIAVQARARLRARPLGVRSRRARAVRGGAVRGPADGTERVHLRVRVPAQHRPRQGHRPAVHAAVHGFPVADRVATRLTRASGD